MDPKAINIEYTDEQIEEITRQVKQEMLSREQMKLEHLDEDTVVQESKLQILKSENEQPKQISIFLIAKTSVDSDVYKSFSEAEKYEWLMNLSIIHLEVENIYRIEKLEMFTNLQVLYLQHNNITKIENLQALESLEYLQLDHNKITTIENLTHLKNLRFLKLDHNLIENFNAKDLPSNLEYINISNNPLKNKSYKKSLVETLKYIEVIDDEELTTEDKFRLLGIFPQQYESYTKSYKQFKQKGKTTQKEQSYLSKMKEATEKKQNDVLALKSKFKKLDLNNNEEDVYKEMSITTQSIKLKQKQKTIEALNDTIQEMNDYAKMHAKRIQIIHKNDPKQSGSLSNSLVLQNYIESREQDLRNNEYELEKIKIQKAYIQPTSELKSQNKANEIFKIQEEGKAKEDEEYSYEEGSEYEESEGEDENEGNASQSTQSQISKNK